MSDSVTEELLARYVAGDCCVAEVRIVEAHLAGSPEAQAWVLRVKDDAVWLAQQRREAAEPSFGADSRAAETQVAGDVRESGRSSPNGPSIAGYEIVRESSRGGQGVVYQAIQRSTKRKVAVKVLLAGQHSSRSSLRRFEREIELIAQLKHPNIIAIFHSGRTAEGVPFYVMDYVRGTPLHEYDRERKL